MITTLQHYNNNVSKSPIHSWIVVVERRIERNVFRTDLLFVRFKGEFVMSGVVDTQI